MTQAEKQTWEQVRAKGRDRFIMREGLLRRSIPFGIIFGLFQAVRLVFFPSHDPLPSIIAQWGFASVAYGSLMGLHYWQQHERDYQKPTEDDDVA